MTPILSIIIPFGLSKERIYIKDRVIQKVTHLKSDEKVEYIFVEGYSSLENNLKQIIEENGHIYLKDESQKDFFSQGKCRNLGACFANAQVIMFLDVDCYISSFSLEKILNLIKIKNIAQCINEFLVLPVVYLTKEGSYKIYKEEEKLWDDIIKDDLISGKNSLIKFFSPSSTSTVIINKHQFLKLGGNNENFKGHSYEDFDLFARILKFCVKFEKMPLNLNYDSRSWDFKNFKGFRSWFSLLGYEACFHGIYMFHFWHEEPNQNGYMQNKDKNHQLFYKNLKNIHTYHLDPLQIYKVRNEKVLVLYENQIYNFEDIGIYIGKLIYKKINDFYISKNFKYEILLDFLEREKITKIFLDGSIKEDKIRNSNYFDLIYFQKGILPNSWFFARNLEVNYRQDLILKKEELEQTKIYFLNLTKEEKQVIYKFLQTNNMECDLYKLLYYLINELYSFEYKGNFYQIIIDQKKMLIGKKQDEIFYSLKSFVYKPYLYEIKKIKPFVFLTKILYLEIISAKISHIKFYRLMKKLFFNPRDFFKDYKIKKIKK